MGVYRGNGSASRRGMMDLGDGIRADGAPYREEGTGLSAFE
jgi:hypothetical protein